YTTECPEWPDWPPGGLAVERAEQLRELFDAASAGDPSGDCESVGSLEELKPTFRELRTIQRYLDEEDRARSAVSRKPGKVPSFKFESNDGWHVIPVECLIIAYRLSEHLRGPEPAPASSVQGKPRPAMRLHTPDSEDINEPTPEQVVAAIEGLN